MEKDIFIDSICRQLQKMSADQKDEWILTRAKLVSESGRQDFMMSLWHKSPTNCDAHLTESNFQTRSGTAKSVRT